MFINQIARPIIIQWTYPLHDLRQCQFHEMYAAITPCASKTVDSLCVLAGPEATSSSPTSADASSEEVGCSLRCLSSASVPFAAELAIS